MLTEGMEAIGNLVLTTEIHSFRFRLQFQPCEEMSPRDRVCDVTHQKYRDGPHQGLNPSGNHIYRQ